MAIYIHQRNTLGPDRLDFAKTFDGLDLLSMCHLGYHHQHAEVDTYEDVPGVTQMISG